MIEIRDPFTDLTKEWYTVAEVAKILGLKDQKDLPIGRNLMFKLLRQEKILMENNYPYQYHLNLELVMMHRIQKTRHVVHIPLFSERGINYLRNRFDGRTLEINR